MLKNLWAVIRPYCTVARVTTAVTAALTPPAALLAGKLAVVLASWGIALDETKTTVVFIAGATAVIAAVVPVVRKFIDNRTAFETALIRQNQAFLISGKSLSAQLDEPTGTEIPPGVALNMGSNVVPDEDYRLSQQHGELADPTDLGPPDPPATSDPTKGA